MKIKTIVLPLIAIAALAGIIWYAGLGDDNQTASITSFREKDEKEFILGDPEAPVTMINFSSHFCGHCVDFHNDKLPLITEKYIKTGQVKYVSKIISPIELGMAIFCADEEGKYWEYNDYLFKHISEIETINDLKEIAGNLGLDQEGFDTCYNSGRHQAKIVSNFEEAEDMKIEGTPTFFINGEEITGNQPIEVFEEAIEKALNQ